jgi:hypothetical protein
MISMTALSESRLAQSPSGRPLCWMLQVEACHQRIVQGWDGQRRQWPGET